MSRPPTTRSLSAASGSKRAASAQSDLPQPSVQMPELAALEVDLRAADLNRLVDEKKKSAGALAQLEATFPPKLRQLTLFVPHAHLTAARQLLLNALPAMAGLERLSLLQSAGDVIGEYAPLSVEPLLQLPRRTHLEWGVGQLTVPQLQVIKQIATLQSFNHSFGYLDEDQLAALCRPPHRLQQLEELNLRDTSVDEAAMADLMCLPALTALESDFLTPEAYALLPRLPLLRRLRLEFLGSDVDDAAQQRANSADLFSALSACPALTHLEISRGECTESFCDQLVRAAPKLRTLRFERCALPSLRFLRHAPNLTELSLRNCSRVRLGHVVGIGALAPRLERLRVQECAGLRLDETERQLLTPPGALGMPQLREFAFVGGPPRQPWE